MAFSEMIPITLDPGESVALGDISGVVSAGGDRDRQCGSLECLLRWWASFYYSADLFIVGCIPASRLYTPRLGLSLTSYLSPRDIVCCPDRTRTGFGSYC